MEMAETMGMATTTTDQDDGNDEDDRVRMGPS